MADTRINLSGSKTVNPAIRIWKRRLFFLFIILFVIFLVNISVVVITRVTLLRSANEINNRRKLLEDSIALRSNSEGLYLTLHSRLLAIDKINKNDPLIQNIPSVVESIVTQSAIIEEIKIKDDNSLEVSFISPDPQSIEFVVDSLRSYGKTGADYSFTNFEAKNSTLDIDGNYSVDLSMTFSRK
jgi:hypothetical protein